jgi:cyclopropane fatty-acyl-phospholipid synthase-like methyltransferase
MKTLSDFVVFHDTQLAKKYAHERIPMSVLYEAYFDGAIDIPGDMEEFLRHRNLFVKHTLTPQHFKWAFTNLIPEVAIHSKEQDKRIVREHYDRGNDFFEWFLGDRMIYTSAYFRTPNETLEQAQDNKMNLSCRKLNLQPGERYLDIGCGWGTLVRHAAKHYGVDATGVTISENQTEYGNRRIADWNLEDSARIVCSDYRDIPNERFDKISNFEMIEHVGVKNLPAFFEQVSDLLTDDGLFVVQWTGLRYGWPLPKGEDLIWGLFMNKYIFPGADASLALSPMLKFAEQAKWEIHSVENVTNSYALTLRAWHRNWLSNEANVKAKYGERWFRIWNLFLPWSAIIGDQGNAACFQVIMNKNIDGFDRSRWITNRIPTLGETTAAFEPPSPEAPIANAKPAAKGRKKTNGVSAEA